jgi:hypothetical protein
LKQFSKIEETSRGITGKSISCEVCEKGKSTKAVSPKQKQNTIRTRVLERIHLDLVGPMQTGSYDKKQYILDLTDDYSRVVMTGAIAIKD